VKKKKGPSTIFSPSKTSEVKPIEVPLSLKTILQPELLSEARTLDKNSPHLSFKITNLLDSLCTTLTIPDLKTLAVSCLEDPPTFIREKNLATIHHKTIFKSSNDLENVSDEELRDHFDALLIASELAVEKMLQSPTLKPPKKPRKPPPSVPRAPTTTTTTPTPPKRSPSHSSKRAKEDDEYGTGPRNWIFQANVTIYDIEASLKSLNRMTWFAKQHIHKMKAKDRVYIWVSGKDGKSLKLLSFDHSIHRFFICSCFVFEMISGSFSNGNYSGRSSANSRRTRNEGFLSKPKIVWRSAIASFDRNRLRVSKTNPQGSLL
jgi:hypothetical protein